MVGAEVESHPAGDALGGGTIPKNAWYPGPEPPDGPVPGPPRGRRTDRSVGRGLIRGDWWSDLPVGRVIQLVGTDAVHLDGALEPLPTAAPAIVTYRPPAPVTSTAAIARLLDALDAVAINLFPAWLPGAAALTGDGAAAAPALRVLAARAALGTGGSASFLASRAGRAMTGRADRIHFADEARALGLTRMIATSYDRDTFVLLLEVPAAVTEEAGRALLAACEWFAHHGRAGVWLTGAVPPSSGERIRTAHIDLPALPGPDPEPDAPAESEVTYSAIAGRPHPGSAAEQALERALAPMPWATGRLWNQTHRFGPLAPVIRVDLGWPVEQCVIEIDGSDHRRRQKYADDRQRDRRLTVNGFAVLRFTNDEIMTNLAAVLHDIRCCIERRRSEAAEGRTQWPARH